MDFHLMEADVEHRSGDRVVWSEAGLQNVFHTDGEEYCLSVLFKTTAGFTVPSFYYVGLDARTTLRTSDTISTVNGEPAGNGYARIPISSATGFTITLGDDGIYRALTSLVTFTATGDGYGPVRNCFLADTAGATGTLISSIVLSQPRTLAGTDTLTFRYRMRLRNAS